MDTRGSILSRLRREPLTVAEICDRLGVTRTAVNVQLKQLQAAGLVRAAETRQGSGAGKPAIVYEAASGSEDFTSQAYRPFVISLLSVLQERMAPAELTALLQAAGRKMAHLAGVAQPKDFESGLEAAMAAADAIGASTEAVPQDGGVMVRNFSCPLGTAVRSENCVCDALAAFFSEATGRPAKAQCVRRNTLTCQYLIEMP